MNRSGSLLNQKLQDATEYLASGQKKEARQALREALALDRKNLKTWELLWQAAYNEEEELRCVKRILAIKPNHKEAKQRMAALQGIGAGSMSHENSSRYSEPISQPAAQKAARRSSSRRKKQQSNILLLFLGMLVSIICASVTGFALYRGGYIPLGVPSGLTATALAEKNASCQDLIDKAIQASGNFCDSTNSNHVCYGNTTSKAELAPSATQRFSERGDMLAINQLRRLTASPLKLDGYEWGIAVFKVIANLPRSLPGETITMVVFGNATLDNTSGDSGNLESFYFSSELGQISCEQVPFDGLMVTSPDGSGMRFTVNGAELTLMGSASIRAIRNGEMEVSVYDGSARIVSEGEEQYFGAGQSVSVDLGGPNGNQAVSAPSSPTSLSEDEMQMACTMTGDFCSSNEITAVSEDQAQAQIQSEITSTPTIVPTQTLSPTPSATIPPTYTLVVLPTATKSPGPTAIPTKTKTRAPTRTPGPTLTPTRTSIPSSTPTFTRTNTPSPTPTFTHTNTPSPTPTFTPSNTPTFTFTPSNTPTFTFTPSPPGISTCADVFFGPLTNPNPNELGVDITNNHVTPITITEFFAYWPKQPISQKLDRIYLNGVMIWNKSDSDTPSSIPSEGNWENGANLAIPNGVTQNLVVQFSSPLQPTGYEVHLTFDIACQIVGTK